MWPNPQEIADLVTFTGEILNGKLYFLCIVFFKKGQETIKNDSKIDKSFTKLHIQYHKVPKIRAGHTRVVLSLYVPNAIGRVKESYRIYKMKQLISNKKETMWW